MFRILLPALLLAGPAMAQARSFQDVAALDTAVAGFTGHAIGEDGGARTAIDSRLKLAQCPTVALSWHGLDHDAVTVTCPSIGWHIYVPVVMTAPAPKSPSIAPTVTLPVKPVIVIHRGDPVMVEAASPGFTISRDCEIKGLREGAESAESIHAIRDRFELQMLPPSRPSSSMPRAIDGIRTRHRRHGFSGFTPCQIRSSSIITRQC